MPAQSCCFAYPWVAVAPSDSRFWRENAMAVVILLNYGFLARIYVVMETSYRKFYHFAIDYSFF